MAYPNYAPLIAEWPNLTPGTTAAKLAQINAMTVTGSVPTSFYTTGDKILNCIVWSEFAALTAQQQQNILALCNNPGQLESGSAVLTKMVPGMLMAYFSLAGPTIAALTALAQAAVQPWWQANGFERALDLGDVAQAGLS